MQQVVRLQIKHLFKNLVVVWALAVLSGCTTQHIVKKADGKSDGIFYALPRTVISVEATVTKTALKPSALMKRIVASNEIAGILLMLQTNLDLSADNVVTSRVVQIEAGDVKISSFAEADPTEIYSIKIEDSWFQNRNFNAKLTEGGLLSSAESTIEDKRLDFALKFLETGASLAGKVIAAGAALAGAAQPTNDVQRARAVVDQLLALRDRRRQLITGNALPPNVQGPTLELMLKEIDQADKDLMATFTGAKRVDGSVVRFDVRPTGDGSFPLLDWLPSAGIMLPETKSAQVSYPTPGEMFATGAASNRLQLTVTFDPPAAEQPFRILTNSPTNDRSYYYRIPAVVLAQVHLGDLVVSGGKTNFKASSEAVRARLAVAQLGRTASMPADINASSSTFKPVFYVNSGALQEITISGKVPDAASLSTLSTAGGAIADALAKQSKADRDAADELNQLKREADLLEQKVRIKTAKEKLGQ